MKKRMSKSKAEKVQTISRHKKLSNIFEMGPLKQVYLDKRRLEQIYLKDAVIVSFQPKRQSEEQSNQLEPAIANNLQQKPDAESISILPTFNCDSKYYTSAFLMPYDGQESDEEMKTYHQNKAKQSQREIKLNDILVAKPKSKHQFCAVCRLHYKDYLTHVQSIEHKRCIRRSKFNQDIQYLSVLIKEKYKLQDKDGVLTRSAKRKFDIVPYDYCELQMKTNKKRRLEGGFFPKAKKSKISTQKQQNFASQAATPFNKRWHMETTAKSINNGF